MAAKQMPIESTIIGVDLLPIKPIHNVKTFQEDITTQKCRNVIKAELRGKHVFCESYMLLVGRRGPSRWSSECGRRLG